MAGRPVQTRLKRLRRQLRPHDRPRIVGPPERFVCLSDFVGAGLEINTNSGSVTLGFNVMHGPDVSLITGTHDIDAFGAERLSFPSSGRDIIVESGAWLGAHCVVLGGTRIGADAVVAAGSVVTADVAPRTLVGGTPARKIRDLGR